MHVADVGSICDEYHGISQNEVYHVQHLIEEFICLAPERGLAPHPFLEGETEELAPLFLDLPWGAAAQEQLPSGLWPQRYSHHSNDY